MTCYSGTDTTTTTTTSYVTIPSYYQLFATNNAFTLLNGTDRLFINIVHDTWPNVALCKSQLLLDSAIQVACMSDE